MRGLTKLDLDEDSELYRVVIEHGKERVGIPEIFRERLSTNHRIISAIINSATIF